MRKFAIRCIHLITYPPNVYYYFFFFRMSLVPLLFRDWWGDFDRPSSLLDQHFGLGLRRDDLLSNWSNLAQSTRPVGAGYLRPWRSLVRSNSGVSNIQAEDNKVQVIWGDDHRRFHARLASLI